MSATIKDVAQLAGVSLKTVSNVLNGYPHLTPETKSKVERALAELHYRPNLSARNLRRGRTGLIALALPNMRSPYFAEIAHLVVKEAEARDLTVLIDCTDGDLERERLVAEGFRSHLLDGIILQPWSLPAAFLRKRQDSTPLVLLGERLMRSADTVAIDSRKAARAATEHLIGLGRRRIGVVGAPWQARSGRRPKEPGRRHQGYEEALAAAGIRYDPDLVVTQTQHDPEGIAAAIEELLEAAGDVDAIFCFNDRIALGAIRCLNLRGYRVPDDIAVVGIDDIEGARLSTPSLSTVAPDKQQIASTALDMLAERMESVDRPARRVVAEFTLVARESTLGRPRFRRARTTTGSPRAAGTRSSRR